MCRPSFNRKTEYFLYKYCNSVKQAVGQRSNQIDNLLQAIKFLLPTLIIGSITLYTSCDVAKTMKNMYDDFQSSERCKWDRDKYFEIYRHFKEDIKGQERGVYTYSQVNDKKIKEGIRIAQNAMRHYSFNNNNPYLIIRSLDAVFLDNSPEDKSAIEQEAQRKPDNTTFEQEREKLLRKVREGLNDIRWPTFEEYQNQKENDKCF